MIDTLLTLMVALTFSAGALLVGYMGLDALRSRDGVPGARAKPLSKAAMAWAVLAVGAVFLVGAVVVLFTVIHR